MSAGRTVRAAGASMLSSSVWMPGSDGHGSQRFAERLQAAPAGQVVVTEMSARDLYNRALEKDRAGDYQGAIDDLTVALGLDPNYALAYNARGAERSRLRDYQRATEDLGEALRLNPDLA